MHDNLDIQAGAKEFTVKQRVVQNNMGILEFNKMLRALPPEQRKSFKKQTRLLAVIPFYAPQGMFQGNETALGITRDKDKLDYLLREAPEFRAVDDPLMKGGKITITG
jgi:hypothetical protein